MSKRLNNIESFETTSSKIQKVLPQSDEIENIKLPIEVIIEIISKFNEINDLRNCMLLSKEIRNSIFISPKIMRKIQIVIKNDEIDEEFQKFLMKKGKYIKIIKLKSDLPATDLIENVFKHVRNLENFTGSLHFGYPVSPAFSRSDSDQSNDGEQDSKEETKAQSVAENHFELPHLKHLTLKHISDNTFFINAVNMKYLTALKIYDIKFGMSETLTNFLALQENLKELYYDASENFPTRDISSEIKFRLTKFSCSGVTENINEFLNFFETQAESLKDLSFSSYCEMDVILKKCKNLEKLTTKDIVFPDENIEDILTNLKYFETSHINESCFSFINKRFPNLESLKCSDFIYEEDDSDEFEAQQIQNSSLSKLKNFCIDFVETKDLEDFNSNLLNIENLKVTKIENISTLLSVIKSLKYFKNLKTFETIFSSKSDFLIKINTVEKTINVESSILNQYKMASDNLQEIFNTFTFNSFLFKDDENLDRFDSD